MFGSTWGNQSQPQQQTNAFGQPSTFGSNAATGAFGSTAFGQPQQQQQQQPQQPQQANPMFGNLGGASAPSGGFGAFGPSNAGTNSAFGAPKPTTGFGAFSGGTGAFGSGSGAFGQTNNPSNASGGIFGQSSTGNTTFGGSSLFGGTKPTTTAFGPTSAPTVSNGSAATPYAVHHEKDPSTSATLQYQAITCMPAYRNLSLEELRLQDYTQNRKAASTTGFGGSAFGSAQPANTGIFGSQTAQPAQTSIFGGTTNTNPPGGFGTFGQANQTNTAQPSTGLFGGSTFGQQAQQQPSAFGAFGQQNQQQQQQQQQPQPQLQQPQQQLQQPQPQQSSGIFGGASTFGNTANKTPFGSTFGNAGTAGSAFGGAGFGQTQPQQQSTGLFGGNQPATSNAFGTFGNANNQNKSLFGTSTSTQPASNTTGFGLFGNQSQPNQQGQQQQQQPAQQSSIFGGTGGGLFGNANTNQQQPQQNPTQPTSLFGNANTGTGLFGNTGGLFGNPNNQQQQQQQTGGQQPAQTNAFGGLFGPKPTGTTSSLFPNIGQQSNLNTAVAQPQTSLFGNTQNNIQQPTLGGGLFGSKPAAPVLGTSNSGQTGGLFGSMLGTSSNMLNTSTTFPGSQPSLTASIAEPIGANLPIFSMLPPGPRSVNLEQSQPKKKAGFFVDVPTRSPVPRVQLGYTPANSKLRGFGASSTTSVNGGNPFASLSLTSGKSNALSLTKSTDGRNSALSDGIMIRSSSPALGSGPRQSVKKVILDKKVEPSELFIKTGSPSSLRGGKITFSPALSVAAREKDAAAAVPSSAPQLDSPTPASKNSSRSPKRFTANSTADAQNSTAEAMADTALQEGDYYVKPDLATLKKASYDQLSSYEGLVVGRVGYGEIHFLEPVDLTGLSKLGALLGDVVRFDDKECSVYPDSEDVDKPPPGSGLNVKARLILERCWATDKASREPIKDSSHPTAIKHLKRLKSMKDTHFENFEMDNGKWTFTVDHF